MDPPETLQLVISGFCPADPEEVQLLLTACKDNTIDMVESFLDRPQDPDLATMDGMTALQSAAHEGSLQSIALLLEARATVDRVEPFDEAHFTVPFTPLMLAAAAGHVEVLQQLLVAKADKNLNCALDGVTPLHIAVQLDQEQVVQLLLDSSARTDVTTRDGVTPLAMAAHLGRPTVAMKLIHGGADFDGAMLGGTTPLIMAADSGQAEVVRVLIEARADIEKSMNSSNTTFETALGVAAQAGYIEVVRVLLDASADLESSKTGNGSSALVAAAETWLSSAKLFIPSLGNSPLSPKSAYLFLPGLQTSLALGLLKCLGKTGRPTVEMFKGGPKVI